MPCFALQNTAFRIIADNQCITFSPSHLLTFSPFHFLTLSPFNEFLAVTYVQTLAQLCFVGAEIASVNAVYAAVVIC